MTEKLLELGNMGMAVSIYAVIFIGLSNWFLAFKIGVERVASVCASIILVVFITDALLTIHPHVEKVQLFNKSYD